MLSPNLSDNSTMLHVAIEHGSENELVDTGGKKTLFLSPPEFAGSLALVLPRCISGEISLGATIRESLRHVKLLYNEDDDPADSESVAIVPIPLGDGSVVTHRVFSVKVSLPADKFAYLAAEYLLKVGEIDLTGLDHPFRENFEAMWNKFTRYEVSVVA